MIRSIRNYSFTIPSGTPQDITVALTSCDPARSIVVFQGAGIYVHTDAEVNLAVNNFPYLKSISSTVLLVNFPFDNAKAAICGCSIIEYI